MSDTDERSVASAGSVAGEPVAYQAVDEYGRPFGYAQIVLPFGKWPKSQRVPLYAQSQPTLTDEEREAIKRLGPCGDPLASRTVTLTPTERRVFHGLLERLG